MRIDNKNFNEAQLIKEIFEYANTELKYEINEKYFNIIDISGDDNCYYNCLSMFFYNSEKNHMNFRESIFEYISNNKNDFLAYFQDYTDNKGKLYDNIIFDK